MAQFFSIANDSVAQGICERLDHEERMYHKGTFIMAHDIKNLPKVYHKALWHLSHPISVKMWVDENPQAVICYHKHCFFDLNTQTQNDMPFTSKIQMPWQLEMLLRFGHKIALSYDATFRTSKTQVKQTTHPTYNFVHPLQ